MPYTPIVGSLGYVLSKDRTKVLLVHRNARQDDHHLGKWSGLGGKMEPHEHVYDCMAREIKEEAGIDCLHMVLRGTINWTNFGPNGENWLGFIFLIDSYAGVPHENNIEGKLEWVDIEKIYDLPMWEGDRHFLPLVFDENPHMFHGYMPYDKGEPLSWSFVR